MPPVEREVTLSLPRVLIAGLRGSGGKTLLSVGVTAALRRRGYSVAPYKKGADYIDSAWLSAAAGQACRNLDLYMVEREEVLRSFARTAHAGDLAIIEGNRGLYDGMNTAGTYSSGELAKLLRAPVVLVCDCTKTTRTLAALVLGCLKFDPEVDIRGVILNKVASARQEGVIRGAIEEYCDLPVLGAVPKLSGHPFPERHLGLIPPQEHEEVPQAVQAAADVAERYVDLEAIVKNAKGAPPLGISGGPGDVDTDGPAVARVSASGGGGDSSVRAGREAGRAGQAGRRTRPKARSGPGPRSTETAKAPRVAVFRDEAFQFYYPENLEALCDQGAELVFASPLRDKDLPQASAIYIGGGFPETMAEALVRNESFRREVAGAVDSGVPIYAECAGAVYLGEKLIMDGRSFAMTGSLPVVFGFGPRPRGHGYSALEVVQCNPFYPRGTRIRGHEFHYSYVLDMDESKLSFAFDVQRGYGMDGRRDGICRANTLATYCHIHALGVKGWAKALVLAGVQWSEDRGAG